ncbi:MAG: hypothetical protein ACK559_35220, partial [bacterium]
REQRPPAVLPVERQPLEAREVGDRGVEVHEPAVLDADDLPHPEIVGLAVGAAFAAAERLDHELQPAIAVDIERVGAVAHRQFEQARLGRPARRGRPQQDDPVAADPRIQAAAHGRAPHERVG